MKHLPKQSYKLLKTTVSCWLGCLLKDLNMGVVTACVLANHDAEHCCENAK